MKLEKLILHLQDIRRELGPNVEVELLIEVDLPGEECQYQGRVNDVATFDKKTVVIMCERFIPDWEQHDIPGIKKGPRK